MAQITILDPSSEQCDHYLAGGKARNLWLLGRRVQCQVPQWFCVTTEAFGQFVEVHETLVYINTPSHIHISHTYIRIICIFMYNCIQTQESNLKNSLFVNPSNLKESADLIYNKIMSSPLPTKLREEISSRLARDPFADSYVAVRSSGTDEDSSAHSFAGEFFCVSYFCIDKKQQDLESVFN